MDTAFIQPGGTGIITIFASKLWPILMTNLLNQQVMGKGENKLGLSCAKLSTA